MLLCGAAMRQVAAVAPRHEQGGPGSILSAERSGRASCRGRSLARPLVWEGRDCGENQVCDLRACPSDRLSCCGLCRKEGGGNVYVCTFSEGLISPPRSQRPCRPLRRRHRRRPFVLLMLINKSTGVAVASIAEAAEEEEIELEIAQVRQHMCNNLFALHHV